MELYQSESCFVCNRNVVEDGVLLSMEMTLYSKTTFPNKLMQLLGDAFMVVILEDDQICIRCANLINHSDKLEQDLKETTSKIMELLNEKYDLNGEEQLSSSAEGLQEPKDNNIYDEENLMLSPNINIKYTYDGKFKPNSKLEGKEELLTKNAVSENVYGTKIKTEPMNSDQYLNYKSSHNISENCDLTISEDLLKKLPKDDIILEGENSTLDSCRSEINKLFQDSQDIVSKELKKEKSADCFESSIQISPLYTNNQISASETLEKSAANLKNDHSHFDEMESKVKLLHDNFCSAKGITEITLSPELLLNHELPKSTSVKVSEAEFLNIKAKNKLRKKNVRPACLSKLGKNNNRKHIVKENMVNTVRKLRPILPKVSDIEEVLPSFYIIQNSDSIFDNDLLKDCPNYNLSTESSNVVRNIKKFKSKKREREINANQRSLNEVEQLSSITELSDFSNGKDLNNHKKELLQDRYKCRFCPKSFKRKFSIKNHEILHTGNFSHYCEFCGQGFVTISKLEHHRRKHTKEESYMCDICGKKFHFQGTYWIHRKWHDNPFPYKCDECGKPFKHSSQLSIHVRKHKGERPYKCSYCHRTFTVSQTLKRHLVLHTKQYPYKCITCDQGFTTRFRYSDHLARKHDTFVEKSSVDPKDYKMVINDDVKEQTEGEPLRSEQLIDFGESNYNIEIPEHPEFIFHPNPSDCHIEIILPSSSMMSDNSLSNISWLT